MGTEHFYSELPVFEDFSAVSEISNYTKLPDDWYIVAADVQNSTGAIRVGLYKAVNIAGVSVITSIWNEAKPLQIPYIFGGDGATLCIPPALLKKAKRALIATKTMVKAQFDLNLRVGIVPVGVVKAAGYDVLIARHRMSKHYVQAAFSGGGVEYAEGLIKDADNGKPYRFEETQSLELADYSGLECRWNHVPSKHGETISLIVKVLAPSITEEATIYNQIIEKIREIYGDDEICRPVYTDGLHFTYKNRKLNYELKVRTFMKNRKAIIKHWLLIRIQNILGRIFMTYKLNIGGVAWGDYKKDLESNTDFKKFDGVLREVISGTEKQRQELQNYLEQRHKKRECVYGIHTPDSALITCMINNRSGNHYHFVDGADGGYAMAAAGMKEQLKQLQAISYK